MKIGTSNIHNAIKFKVSIAYDAYVDIFYGRLLFHQGRFVFVSKNILLVYFFSSKFCIKLSLQVMLAVHVLSEHKMLNLHVKVEVTDSQVNRQMNIKNQLSQ